jgi:hypothetical protein
VKKSDEWIGWMKVDEREVVMGKEEGWRSWEAKAFQSSKLRGRVKVLAFPAGKSCASVGSCSGPSMITSTA